jgi:DNA helicase-2/ATP-dependent DNA helicase PcrA
MNSSLLDGLNPQQLEAVTLPRMSALILAGAGSGKTRVLTTRIAWLIQTGQVSPMALLAVTFTNKAAREMLTRISAMLPINTRGMWVGTFHGLCNRLLRAHHREAALPAAFQILDSADQLSIVKRVMRTLNIDDEKYPPRQAQWFINAQKEAGLRSSQVDPPDDFARRLNDVYEAYDRQCNQEGVVDFAELLLRSYELLKRNEVLRAHYQSRFQHILVDEFQDTNKLQYSWLKLLAGQEAAVFAVGDDDQCVAKGTPITMADGSRRVIERVRVGDEVRSCFGSGELRAARVMRVHQRSRITGMIEIELASGRKIVSTPQHTHFAGYLLGETPQTYFTYLMYKRGIGYRLGTSQVYTRGQAKPMVGFKQRLLQEHGDALWIVGTHDSEAEARFNEIRLSLRYGLPTLPFVPRKGKSINGLVNDAMLIERLFRSLETDVGANRLLSDLGLDSAAPHHVPRSRDSHRRHVTVTLCGDSRGTRPMHRIALFGNDDESERKLLAAGFSVRPVKVGRQGWRVETARASFGELMEIARALAKLLAIPMILNARLGRRALPFVAAGHVRPGMVMLLETTDLEPVVAVRTLRTGNRVVYDLDIENTHNYVAAGVVTHNSIYAFRGADVGNMASFERDFRIEKVIKLEQNYRSHGNILDAANALIANNRERLGKNLWTAEGSGEPLRVFEAATDGEEAAFIVDEVKSLQREDVRLSDIALLYRSNAQSRVLEHALFNAAIPYRVYGGLRFFERQEVKHALAYLRLVANPEDDGALLRVINFPARGIGARSVEQLQEAGRQRGTSLWQAGCSGALGGKAGSSIAAFVQMVEGLRRQVAGLPLAEIVEHVIEGSGLKQHYQTEKEGAERLENLDELVNAAAAFVVEAIYDPAAEEGGTADPNDPLATLNAFLAHAALEAGEHQAGAGAEALQLMTVHSAKGLEFHTVFVSGLEEGLFPHENSLNEDDGLEEERRLMYVAITRARRRLYLSYAQSRMLHGQTRYNVASRFLEEVPPQLLKRLNAAPTRAWAPPPFRSSAPPAFTSLSDRDSGWRIGQNVVHPKFGAGVIVSSEGRGSDARVQVNFRNAGLKWLALEYAKLTAA